jgi:hypothetical protein
MVSKLDYSGLSSSKDDLEDCIAQHTIIVDLKYHAAKKKFLEGL